MPPETIEASSENAFAEADAALDNLPPVPETEAAPAKPTPPSAPAAPAAAPEPAKASEPKADADDDIPAAPAAKPKEPPKPDDGKPAKGRNIENWETVRKQKAALETERDSAKAELAALKIEREKLLDEGRKTAAKELQAEIDALKKQQADLDFELRCANYSRSKDYKDRFETPLNTAWEKAVKAIGGLKLIDASGNERQAGFDDLYQLTQMEEVQAWQRANELFGVSAPAVMKHRDRIIELEEGRDAAVKEYREKGNEREAALAKEREESEAEKMRLYEEHLTNERTQKSEFFAEDAADEKGNEWLRAGTKLVRKAMFGDGIPQGITPQEKIAQRIKAQAMMANRAAAYGRERHRVLVLRAENEDLRAKLAAFEKSEPDAKTPPKDHAPSGEEGDMDHEFNKAGL